MKILCADCKQPKAKFDYVLSAGNPYDTKVLELCEECLGKKIVGLIEDNFRFLVTAFLVTAWTRQENGYTKVVVEGVDV